MLKGEVWERLLFRVGLDRLIGCKVWGLGFRFQGLEFCDSAAGLKWYTGVLYR